LLGARTSFAAPPPIPPIPSGTIDEYNVLVLVDVSGSMADPHAAGTTKLQQALNQAKNDILKVKAKAGSTPIEFALWAFDSSFPQEDGWLHHVVDFPGQGAGVVLGKLGFDSSGNPSGTPDPVFTPTESTPLAGAGCFAGYAFVAKATDSGVVVTPGYEYGKTVTSGGTTRQANIERHLFIETDGIENSTPEDNTDPYNCGGPTSLQPYETYEAESWQAKLRNTLLTGNPRSVSTLPSGLIIDVNLIFQSYITGMSAGGHAESRKYSASTTPYTTEPTLGQSMTFYNGLTTNTRGTFKTVTVRADGVVDARRPGDVDYSGCVGNADYAELIQWYGTQVTPVHPHSYWADLNGDSWVDYYDYLILAQHWGEGGTC